ncbi:hypothetical protein KCU71_g5110, partial [Aureobasidium melanogenum]
MFESPGELAGSLDRAESPGCSWKKIFTVTTPKPTFTSTSYFIVGFFFDYSAPSTQNTHSQSTVPGASQNAMFSTHHWEKRPDPVVPVLVKELPIYAPPCACSNCEQQFVRKELQQIDRHRYESVIAPDVARNLLADFVNKTNSDRSYLAGLCHKYGNTILSRWRKKSRDKREALLLQADPSIEREPFLRLRDEPELRAWRVMRHTRRKSWLLPYMNTTLMKENPLILLGLIHHRVQHTPEEWAPFDSDLVRQGWSNGMQSLEYCGHYCIVMNGVNYGKLVSWSKEAAERWDIVGYPRARLVIEAQALMYSRLRSIVDLILEGVKGDSVGASDKWQEMVQIGFKQSNNIELWSDYINQPFSSPPKFDVDYYCSLAKARMQAAQDHLWLLQTDPSYVRRFIKVMAVGEVYRSDWKHALVAEDMHQAVEDYLRWREIHGEWSCVQDQYRRFRDSIYPGRPLPARLDLSLALLEAALHMAMKKRTLHLSSYVPQRPGFQHLWKITMGANPSTSLNATGLEVGKIERTCKTPAEQVYHDDPFDWTLFNLQGDPNAEFRFDHSELFAKLEYHVARADTKERARLDETIYAKMSDFAAEHEMLSAVRLHRPAFGLRRAKESGDMLRTNLSPFTRALTPDDTYPQPVRFPSQFMKSFDRSAPAVGPKNQAWLDCRTAERKALSVFWNQAREALRRELGPNRMKQEELQQILSLISVSTSPEYTEMLEREQLEVVAASNAAASAKSASNTVTPQAIFWDTGPDVSKLTIEERAPKQKTRPVQPTNKPVDDTTSFKPSIDKDTEAPIPLQIPATARALEIIRKMFPSSAEETSAKDTDWDLFVHAMTDLTFSARNVGGSAIAFEHPSNQKIIFHRPHPVAKIDSIMLQSMGKRLKKHFDWSREAFIGV